MAARVWTSGPGGAEAEQPIGRAHRPWWRARRVRVLEGRALQYIRLCVTTVCACVSAVSPPRPRVGAREYRMRVCVFSFRMRRTAGMRERVEFFDYELGIYIYYTWPKTLIASKQRSAVLALAAPEVAGPRSTMTKPQTRPAAHVSEPADATVSAGAILTNGAAAREQTATPMAASTRPPLRAATASSTTLVRGARVDAASAARLVDPSATGARPSETRPS